MATPEVDARVAEALVSGQCSLTRETSDGGGGRCPRPATRITPVEVTENGVAVLRWSEVVCDYHDPFHYAAHSIALGEMPTLDWSSDPRVLRYDREATMAQLLDAIDDINDGI